MIELIKQLLISEYINGAGIQNGVFVILYEAIKTFFKLFQYIPLLYQYLPPVAVQSIILIGLATFGSKLADFILFIISKVEQLCDRLTKGSFKL